MFDVLLKRSFKYWYLNKTLGAKCEDGFKPEIVLYAKQVFYVLNLSLRTRFNGAANIKQWIDNLFSIL